MSYLSNVQLNRAFNQQLKSVATCSAGNANKLAKPYDIFFIKQSYEDSILEKMYLNKKCRGTFSLTNETCSKLI